LIQSRRCPYCQSSFLPSAYCAQQSVCSQPECQRRRRRIITGRSWRQTGVFPSGARQPEAVVAEHPATRNNTASRTRSWSRAPSASRLRDRKRRLNFLSGTTCFGLKAFSVRGLAGGPKVRKLDRNNLASAHVLILPSLGHLPEDRGPS